MTPEQLLRDLESLSHDVCVRRMVEWGRASREDAGVAATVATLWEHGERGRWLALLSCFGSGDGELALQALSDPSPLVRGCAVTLIPLIGTDEQAQQALKRCGHRERRVLLRRLAKRGRRAPVDAYLAGLPDGEKRLAASLPYGSRSMVERRLEPALVRADPSDWQRLARWHPEIAIRTLAHMAQSRGEQLVEIANRVLVGLVRRATEHGAALVDAISGHVPLTRLELQYLANRRPVDIAELVLHSRDRPDVYLTWGSRRLSAEQVLGLIERGFITLDDRERWFPRLAPAQRAGLYDAVAAEWRDEAGCLAPEIVAHLRRDQREYEGRRHLALPALASRPVERLAYAVFLPWEEARETLAPCLQAREAELRAAALSALARATRYHRDRLPELLAEFRSRLHEREPVRGAMLAGLVDLPASVWSEAHLEELGAILRAVLGAADLSAAETRAMERLILKLLPAHPEWSAMWLATLIRERGPLSGLWELCVEVKRMPAEDARRIAPHLLPVLRPWAARRRRGFIPVAEPGAGIRPDIVQEAIALLERSVSEAR